MAFGVFPSEVGALPVSEYDLLLRYWNQEPWGTYRDNLHAGLIAREVRRTVSATHLEMDNFMILPPKPDVPQTKEDKEKLFAFFRTVAKDKRARSKRDKAKAALAGKAS